jgi:hypothetical protein
MALSRAFSVFGLTLACFNAYIPDGVERVRNENRLFLVPKGREI